MGLGPSSDSQPDPLSPEQVYTTKMYEETVVLPGSIHKLLTGESEYTRCLFLLARHVLQPALEQHRAELSPPMEQVFAVLLRLTHEHLRLANAFSAFSILEYLEYSDSDINGHRLGHLLLLLVPLVSIYESYLHCFQQLRQPITPDSDPWLCDYLTQRFAQPSHLMQLLVLPLQRLNQLVDRIREVLLVIPNTYADYGALRRAFTQHIMLQNMENCDLLKQVAVSGFLCTESGGQIGFPSGKQPVWGWGGATGAPLHAGELLCRSNCNWLVWRPMWALLMRSGHLLFYRDEREVDSEPPMAVVQLYRASLDCISLPHKEYAVKLCSPERVYYISFETSEQQKHWCGLVQLEPSDVNFGAVQFTNTDMAECELRPAGGEAGEITPTISFSSLNLEPGWPDRLDPGCEEPIIMQQDAMLWSHLSGSPNPGLVLLSGWRLCFQPANPALDVIAVPLNQISSLRRTNSGVVNCHSFRVCTTNGLQLCFAELTRPEEFFYAAETLWHATLQCEWHAAQQQGAEANQHAAQCWLERLSRLRAKEMRVVQLTEQARSWFKLPADEQLLCRFGCSLIHRIVFTGHMYITSSFICFCSAQYGERVAVVIPRDAVEVEKYDTMMLMPCAIRLTTAIGEYLLGDFGDRDNAYETLKRHVTTSSSANFADSDRSPRGLTEGDTNSADTDTAYTCMESEASGGATGHTSPQASDSDDSMGACRSQRVSEKSTAQEGSQEDEMGILVDECGFLLPPKHRQLITAVCASVQAQQRQVWSRHLKLNGRGIELVRTKSLVQLTRYWGIPFELRGMVWASCSGALNWRHTHRGRYLELCQQQPPEEVQEQIRKDLNRSLHTHEDFARPNAPGLAKLQRVLSAYACYNPALGYCQAMNFLCAFLLVFMDEEQAFWTLCCIVEQLLPDYFTYDLLGSLVDCAVFEELVGDMFPATAEYLEGLPLYPVSRWFMGLFLHVMPYATVARIWDCFLCEGATALFRVGLALFKLNESAISSNTDPNEFLQRVQRMAETCYDSTEVLRVAFDDQLALSSTRIRDLRARHRVRLLQEQGRSSRIL